MRRKINIADFNNQELLQLSVRLQKAWRNYAIIWTIVYYSSTILSFFASIIVIFLQTSSLSNNLITLNTIILTSISSTLVVVSFCINPRRHKMVYRRAFDILNSAVLSVYHSADDGIYEHLARSIIQGERIISSSLEVEYDNDESKAPYDVTDKCPRKIINYKTTGIVPCLGTRVTIKQKRNKRL